MKKRILYFSLSLFITLGLFSCDSWLDLVPESSITTGSMWKSSSDAKAALTGSLNRFRLAFQTDYISWGDYRTGFYGNGSGNGAVARGPIWLNQLTSSTMSTNWNALYTAINDCNLVLKYTPGISFNIEDEKNHILGSAYFLRAFMYYFIGRTWGDAPILTEGFESDNQEGLFPTRQPVSDMFNQIEQDLNKALELLKPGMGKAPLDVTREAVCMLQTDFYLWQAKVNNKGTDAISKADAAITMVLNSGKNLDNSYEAVFRNDANPELIFSIAFIESENTSPFSNEFLVPLAFISSTYHNNPVQVGGNHFVSINADHKDFLWSTPNDSRASINISEFTQPADGVYVKWINKYIGTWKSGTRIWDSDIRVYRFAEALLFKAEIEIARNNISGALPYLNRIAKRAYGVDDFYSGVYTQAEIENILVDERLKELATEGKSWFDLIRLGQVFKRVDNLKGRENEQNILLWPVNTSSINTNPAITQTPGYN